jgi:hypothetical protein
VLLRPRYAEFLCGAADRTAGAGLPEFIARESSEFLRCGDRRMNERAAHLVDDVIPFVPVRQWVFMLPYRLRYLVAWDHRLSRAVLAIRFR